MTRGDGFAGLGPRPQDVVKAVAGEAGSAPA